MEYSQEIRKQYYKLKEMASDAELDGSVDLPAIMERLKLLEFYFQRELEKDSIITYKLTRSPHKNIIIMDNNQP